MLSAASLMVGEAGFEEAVRVARANPALAVGLHVTLTDGVPVLPPRRIPALVQRNGRFRDDMAGLGLLLALSREARAELHAEIASQLARFVETGLRCDHVNAHKHYHLHPHIAAALMQAAAGAGIPGIRLPNEDGALVRRADPASPGLPYAILNRWCAVLRRRAANWALRAPDSVLGHAWSGAFTAARLRAAIPLLAAGVTELYFHPATRGGFPGAAPGYRYEEELAALTDPGVRDALAGIPRGGYRSALVP